MSFIRHLLVVVCVFFFSVVFSLKAGVAEATTWYASPSGSGSSCTSSSPCSLGTVNGKVVAGDTVSLGSGTYNTILQPANSGTASKPITYAGQSSSVVLTQRAIVSGKSYIILDKLKFQTSNPSTWITTDANTDHLTVTNCTFSNNYWGTFSGIDFLGTYLTMRNNTILDWYGGNSIWMRGDYGIFENNDFSRSNAGHGSLIIDGNYVIVRNNYFRNEWDRATSIVARNGEDSGNRLIENNIFFDNNWNRTEDLSDKGYIAGEPGADHIAKTGGSILIFRNNLVVGSETGKADVIEKRVL